MSRGVGEFEVVQGAIPESLALVVALLTQLGDIWFVSLLLIVAFARFERDRIATVAGLAIGAVALVFTAKYVFALPRPDQPLVALGTLPAVLQPVYEATGYASGYGFPSGHATVTTVVYLALAEVLPAGSRRGRYAAAVGLIALVSLSRVALGLHFLVDVVAGIALGLAFLLVARRLLARYRSTDRRRTVAIGLGVALAGVSVLASGGVLEPLLLFAVSIGAFSLSWLTGGSRAPPSRVLRSRSWWTAAPR
ncbi:MAG: phosphatase PAP2 family protein [Halalkalicoccus sp.]